MGLRRLVQRPVVVPALAALGRDDDPLGFVKSQPAAARKRSPIPLPVSGLLFTGNATTPTCRAVGAGSADLMLPGASLVSFPAIYRGAAERRSATPVAGRAFRARGAVTACRLKESQGQP